MAEEKIIIIYILLESSCLTGQYKYPRQKISSCLTRACVGPLSQWVFREYRNFYVRGRRCSKKNSSVGIQLVSLSRENLFKSLVNWNPLENLFGCFLKIMVES